MGTITSIPNPLKVIREKHNLSQKAFASLAGIGEQVIIRNELGMFPDINPSILHTCLSLEEHTIGADELRDQYELYILSQLAQVTLPYTPSREELNTVDGMAKYRKALTEANEVGDSNYSMCKLLKVHLYPLDRFMKGRKDTAPIQIIERIDLIRHLQTGLTEEDNGNGGRKVSN